MATWEEWLQGAANTALDVWREDRAADHQTEALKLQQYNPMTGQRYIEGQPNTAGLMSGTGNGKTLLVVAGLAVVAFLIVKA